MEPRLATTTVYLTDFEAELFLKFQKHYSLIGFLESIKAFDIKPGSVTIHFNKLGEIVGATKKEEFSI